MLYGLAHAPVLICPFRLLERRQVFSDCLHLLTTHEPGNELHIVSEVSIPGGSVDYFLVSAKGGKVRDFVGVEFQTLDTTGTLWPERQRFLDGQGVKVNRNEAKSRKGFGMNWKMTAKTTLVQLHHKVRTFEQINKHLALVIQDCLFEYMRCEFNFGHLNNARLGDSMHMHPYAMGTHGNGHRLSLGPRFSTDSAGVAMCLGLQAGPHVELEDIIAQLQTKMSDETLFTVQQQA